jgi:hypothetical protein
VYQGPAPWIASVMSGSWLPAAARPICTGCVPGARPRVAIVATSVRVPGRKPFIEIAVSKIRLPIRTRSRRSKYIDAFPLFVQFNVRSRLAPRPIDFGNRASEHEAVAELRDHVLYGGVHYRGGTASFLLLNWEAWLSMATAGI